MAHDYDELIADLDAAKADLARTVKRCRTFFGERRLPPLTVEEPADEPSAFSWGRRKPR